MTTLEQRIAALEAKAKRAAQRDDRPWEVIFAETCEQWGQDVDEMLKPFGGDAGAYLDHAEKVNTEAMQKIAR